MNTASDFDHYLTHLSAALGHADRHAGLSGYCTGLMLPLSRKSVEPMAARIDPLHASAKHQSLHHFVAKASWSDQALLRRVAQWVVPQMDFSTGGWWIIDDTGFPKKGKHSVGVARQYCGVLGKQDNCQVAVSVSLACEMGSIPVAWQLYLPAIWAQDKARRAKAGVPEAIEFATKPQIALQQMRDLLAQGAPQHCVLADEGYGIDYAFRQGLSDMGLAYMVGITAAVVVWPPGVQPLPPKSYSGMGRPSVMPRRTARTPADERQGTCTGFAGQRISHHQLARRQQCTIDRALCRAQSTLRGQQCGVKPAYCPSSGCSSSGLLIKPSLRNTICPHCQRRQQSTIWWLPRICAGALNATTKI